MANLSNAMLMLVTAANIKEMKIEKGQNAGKIYYQVRFDSLPTPEQKAMQVEYGCVIDMPHSTRNIFENMQQFDAVKALFESGDKTAKKMFFAELNPTVELPVESRYYAKNPNTGEITKNVVTCLRNVVILAGETTTSYLANILRNIDPAQMIQTTVDNGSSVEPLED